MCYRRLYHQYILMLQSLSFLVFRYAYFPVLYCHDLSLCFADLLKISLDFRELPFQYQHDQCILCLRGLPADTIVSTYPSTLDMSPHVFGVVDQVGL